MSDDAHGYVQHLAALDASTGHEEWVDGQLLSRWIARKARGALRVHTIVLRPNALPLARCSASSHESTAMIGAVGPKVSSCMMSMSSVTAVRTVGGKK